MTWLRVYWPVLAWLTGCALVVGLLVALFLDDRRHDREAEEAEALAALERLYVEHELRGKR